MQNSTPENPNDSNICYQDFTDDIACAWLKSVVKLQRQVLILTSAVSSHENCEELMRDLLEKCGAFGCCHGVFFTPSEEVNNQNSGEAGSSTGAGTEGGLLTEFNFVSEIQKLETFFQNLLDTFETSDKNSSHKNSHDCNDSASFDKLFAGYLGLISGQNEEDTSSCTFFDCPICLDSIPEQLAFSLGPFRHTICVGCTKKLLVHWNRSNSANIQCPICRENFPIRQFVRQFSECFSSYHNLHF